MQRRQDTWNDTVKRCFVVGAVVAALFAGLAATVEDTRSTRLAQAPDASERFDRGT